MKKNKDGDGMVGVGDRRPREEERGEENFLGFLCVCVFRFSCACNL